MKWLIQLFVFYFACLSISPCMTGSSCCDKEQSHCETAAEQVVDDAQLPKPVSDDCSSMFCLCNGCGTFALRSNFSKVTGQKVDDIDQMGFSYRMSANFEFLSDIWQPPRRS